MMNTQVNNIKVMFYLFLSASNNEAISTGNVMVAAPFLTFVVQ